MPDELFRTSCSHNSAPHSDIVKHTLHFYLHFGAGHKGIKPLICKHIVVYDLLPRDSRKFMRMLSLRIILSVRLQKIWESAARGFTI